MSRCEVMESLICCQMFSILSTSLAGLNINNYCLFLDGNKKRGKSREYEAAAVCPTICHTVLQ